MIGTEPDAKKSVCGACLRIASRKFFYSFAGLRNGAACGVPEGDAFRERFFFPGDRRPEGKDRADHVRGIQIPETVNVCLEFYEQGIYCNGRTISVWDPDLRQVTVKAIASSMPSSPAAILFGNNDFRRDFTVKDAGTKDGLEWIDAVPKLHDTSFTDIRIGFRDGLPAAMTLKDSFGQTITLHMSDMKKNPSISSSAFEFRPPKGAEILRQ